VQFWKRDDPAVDKKHTDPFKSRMKRKGGGTKSGGYAPPKKGKMPTGEEGPSAWKKESVFS